MVEKKDKVPDVKFCPQCNRFLELSMYHKDKSTGDGLRGWCKECVKLKYIENKEKYLSYSKEYRRLHKDKIREYFQANKTHIKIKTKEYYENNKDVLKSKSKEYRKNNKEYYRDYARAYRAKHRDDLKEKRKVYYESHKDKIKEIQERYKQKLIERLTNERIDSILNNEIDIVQYLKERGVCISSDINAA